jgi:hypothetical protein
MLLVRYPTSIDIFPMSTRLQSMRRDFHSRCDGDAPTLALIQGMDESIFECFMPVK